MKKHDKFVMLAKIKLNSIETLISQAFFSGYNIRMLEIAIENCHKCDSETIIDPNNSIFLD